MLRIQYLWGIIMRATDFFVSDDMTIALRRVSGHRIAIYAGTKVP